jgi:serine acetyltransferase
MGTSVGDGCIVGMGAVVVKPIEATGALIGGVPAKVIAENAEYDAPAAFALRRRPYFDGERVIHPPAN